MIKPRFMGFRRTKRAQCGGTAERKWASHRLRGTGQLFNWTRVKRKLNIMRKSGLTGLLLH